MSEAVCICLCNGLTDRAVGQAIAQGATRPGQVYTACAGKAQCGSCVRMILAMIREPSVSVAGSVAGSAGG